MDTVDVNTLAAVPILHEVAIAKDVSFYSALKSSKKRSFSSPNESNSEGPNPTKKNEDQ